MLVLALFANRLFADGKLDFDSFVSIASSFLEEEDDEAMQQELKEAFRLYDKEGKPPFCCICQVLVCSNCHILVTCSQHLVFIRRY